MGRPIRLKGDNLTFHITSRTNGKKLFMKKKSDHKALCLYLLKSLEKHDIVCHAFSPMTNHFHLIIHLKDNGTDLSQFMCEFKTAYAKYFNTKYKTCGHFWGDRFKSTIIEDEKYMLTCLRYVDRNALKAKLVNDPTEWIYSSYSCYAHGKDHPVLPIQLHPTYLALSRNKKKRWTMYTEFVLEPNALSDNLHGTMDRRQFLASDAFINNFMNY